MRHPSIQCEYNSVSVVSKCIEASVAERVYRAGRLKGVADRESSNTGGEK